MGIQENINPYDEKSFREEFPKTEHYALIKKLYPNAVLSYDNKGVIGHQAWLWFYDKHTRKSKNSPRENMLDLYNRISVVDFYYLKYLDPNATIYDLGCGMNFFKPFFKNLIGIDPYDKKADICETIDDNFYKNYESHYDSMFSICALHFNSIEKLREICEKFTLMLKPNCTGFLSLNTDRMIEQVSKDKINFFNKMNDSLLEMWVRKELFEFPHELKVFEVRCNNGRKSGVHGNIKLVVTRSK